MLAKSVTPSRIEENAKVIKLDESDMEALESISKTRGLKRFVYPEFGVSLVVFFSDRATLTHALQVNLGFPDKQ